MPLGPALPSSPCTVLSKGKIPLSPQIDLQKMPLGKLSKRQIQAAYSILSEVQQVSEGPAFPPAAQGVSWLPCHGRGAVESTQQYIYSRLHETGILIHDDLDVFSSTSMTSACHLRKDGPSTDDLAVFSVISYAVNSLYA